jgi:hypothetical protein
MGQVLLWVLLVPWVPENLVALWLLEYQVLLGFLEVLVVPLVQAVLLVLEHLLLLVDLVGLVGL